jgi:hypothetical protein
MAAARTTCTRRPRAAGGERRRWLGGLRRPTGDGICCRRGRTVWHSSMDHHCICTITSGGMRRGVNIESQGPAARHSGGSSLQQRSRHLDLLYRLAILCGFAQRHLRLFLQPGWRGAGV